jgi:hypothetical protein
MGQVDEGLNDLAEGIFTILGRGGLGHDPTFR